MTKRLSVSLMVCFVVAVSIVFVQLCLPIQRTVTAAEATPDSAQDQLHQKLLERKQLLDQEAEEVKRRFDVGSGTSSEYLQAKEAALRAGIDLCQSKVDKINVYKQILEAFTQVDKLTEMETTVGQRSLSDLRKTKVARLNIEIELLKVQLN